MKNSGSMVFGYGTTKRLQVVQGLTCIMSVSLSVTLWWYENLWRFSLQYRPLPSSSLFIGDAATLSQQTFVGLIVALSNKIINTSYIS